MAYLTVPSSITVREGVPFSYKLIFRDLAPADNGSYNYFYYDPGTWRLSEDFGYSGGGGSYSGAGRTTQTVVVTAEAHGDRKVEGAEDHWVVVRLPYGGPTTFQDGRYEATIRLTVLDSSITTGTDRNDVLWGTSAIETLRGKGGNDRYHLQAGESVIEYAGAGIDTVYIAASHRLNANVERLFLEGGGNFSGTGNGLANFIVGNDGNNVLRGGGGDDVIKGGLGNDLLLGEAGNDRLTAIGSDTLNGGTGDDRMWGDYGSVMIGSTGRDVIFGGDTFVFRSVEDSGIGWANRDAIHEFGPLSTIDLRRIDANTQIDGNQAFKAASDFIGRLDDAPAANSVWCVRSGDNLVLRADVDGDAIADFEIGLIDIDSISVRDILL